MNQSYSDNDISMSPSQILERLQMLRQLQLMQRGKLQKQRLQFQENSETSSCITEMITHFTNSLSATSYNTFQSLLQSPVTDKDDDSHSLNASEFSSKVQDTDLIDGVAVLNLSQESEFIVNTPISGRTAVSPVSKSQTNNSPLCDNNSAPISKAITLKKKPIHLDDMPILSPKKDFESLVLEKLKCDKNAVKSPQKDSQGKKRTFLRKGEGMSRFGLRKNDLIIQNTKSLPWKKKNVSSKPLQSKTNKNVHKNSQDDNLNVDIVVPPLQLNVNHKNKLKEIKNIDQSGMYTAVTVSSKTSIVNSDPNTSPRFEFKIVDKIIQQPKIKHPALASKGKTWASILTKEQNDFLTQLKQSDYYKNFASPAKSTISDMSYDENTSKLKHEKESAEQNLFNLLENKVSNESFHMENSFFNRFLKRSNLECSGESTPIVMQRCLANNPNLMHIVPDSNHRQKNDSYNEGETCQSDYTECCSEVCSSVSSCCSCKTVEHSTFESSTKVSEGKKVSSIDARKEVPIQNENESNCQDDNEQDMKANIVEMNKKLITTSELLKERLQELEDEIETFRKENMNLNKMKEEIDLERQKFYEEKKDFEQKFNEEKILSEYYLADEKEKLNKQKQIYERYVREMRGKLNKKEKEEVVNFKQEINSLKEEIRVKDAKSTSTIARLRNQMKIMEKEKAGLQNEVDKLKKENRRIQHSNEITRRLTNMKYLEQINKKLSNMNKESQSEVKLNSDVKYKAFEIERQSRSSKAQTNESRPIRARARSVPNLKVTSRYAKYFSQRDAVTHRESNPTVSVERFGIPLYDSDEENLKIDINENSDDNISNQDNTDYSDNNLERIYMDTFKSISPRSNRSSKSNSNSNYLTEHNSAKMANSFFLRKSNSSSSTRDSKSPVNLSTSPPNRGSLRSKSPVSIQSHRSSQKSPIHCHNSLNLSADSNNSIRSKSPISISNHSTQMSATVIHKDIYQDQLMKISPEHSSRTSLSKTNLNPTEYRKSDGSRELRFPNGNVKHISSDGKYCKFVYYNGDVKENFYHEGRIKYYYAENKTYHTTHADGLEIIEFPDGQVEKRYKDGSTEIRLPNGSVRYHDPKNVHVREEWRFPDGSSLTVSASGERRIVFTNGQIEVHADDHKRREFPDGTVKLVYNDGTSETRYASGRVRIKDKHGHLIMDSAPG